MPNRVLAKLKTRDIKGVEILDEGVWNASTGTWEVTRDTTERILSNFKSLGELCVPPLKLGHSDDQALLQADGYPAAGWVERLYRKGTKILADFAKVPEKIAELIDAGAYRKVSVEVWKSSTFDGKKYDDVLMSVALLGNEVPAVSTLSDIVALYASKAPITFARDHEAHLVLYPGPKRKAELGTDTSTDERHTAVDNAIREKFGAGLSGYDWPWPVEWFDEAGYVVARGSDVRHWQIPFTFGSDGSVSLGTEIEVKQTWRPISEMAGDPGTKDEEASMDAKRIAAALGLSADATEDQVLASITTIKAASPAKLTKAQCDEKGGTWDEAAGTCKMPESASATLAARVTKLESENTELKTAAARRDTKDAVDTAIRAKKLAPAQRVWAETYAQQDPKGFEAYVKDAPEIFKASGGTEAGADETDDDGVTKIRAKTAEFMKADPAISYGEAQVRASRELATAAR